jgi:IS4 transposase
MSLSSFEKIVKRCLAHLPKDDYPALDTRKFVSTWISFVLDQSQTSMRSMIQRLNIGKINVNLSTFSKASKNRSPEVFKNLWLRLCKEANKIDKRGEKVKDIFPLDSTIISLTSKLLWQQEIYQVKLFSGTNVERKLNLNKK